jgi:TP901 family phage tail tape measure protein
VTDLALSILISAQDQASKVITSIGAALGPLGPILAGAAAGLVAFGVQSVQTAADFQRSMNMVQSLTGATTQQMAQYSTGIKQLASDTGVAATKLTNGLYFMTSAGYSGADALKMLTLSTKDAVIGQTSATTTASALTKVMNGFSVNIKYADQVNGEMLRTVTAGEMTMSDYASAISKTSSVAVQYHDSMENMNAVLATLTFGGIKNANVAGTDYNNLLKVLNGNTQAVASKSHALNSAFDTTKFAAMDVAGKVNYLNTMIIAHGHNITDVIGKQQNAAAAFTVLSQHADVYAKNLKNLSDQQANAAATQDQWKITQGGLEVSMNRMQAALQNVMIDLGNAFLPILTRVMNVVTDVITNFTNWEERTHFIQNALDALGAALAPLWSAVQQVGTTIDSVFGNIAPTMDGLAAASPTWGANMMNGFISGVESMLGALFAILDQVATEISNFLGFASPTKKGAGRNVMRWGPAMVASFAGGITGSIPLIQDAVDQASQPLAALGSSGSGQSSAASSSFVSIGSALQTVTMGHPFGQSGGATSTASSTVTALGTTVTALGANTGAVVALTAKQQAAAATKAAAATATAAKHAATLVKSQQTATAAAAKLSATQTKALTDSNSAGVQKLVAESRAASASGNMAMAKLYASQAQTLATKEHAAAVKAAKVSKGKGGAASAGGGAGVPAVSENSILGQMPTLAPPAAIQQAQAAGKTVATAYSNGFKTIQNNVKPALDGVVSFVRSTVTSLAQIIKPSLQIVGQVFIGAWNTLKIGASMIGTLLLPALGSLVTAIAPIIAGFLHWVAVSGLIPLAFNIIGIALRVVIGVVSGLVTAVAAIITWLTQWRGVITTTATALLVLFAPALIKIGVESAIAGAKMAASFIANIVKTGVESVVSGAKMAISFTSNIIKAGIEGWTSAGKLVTFVAQLVASGVQAAAAGVKIAASFVANLVKTAAQAVATGAVIAAKFVWSLIQAGAQAVVSGAMMLASLVPALISVIAQAVIAAAVAIPGLVAGFVAWTIGAGAAAIATIAATWPILAIAAIVVAVVAIIVLAVTHWGAIMDWITGKQEQLRLQSAIKHSQMAADADKHTAQMAQKSIANIDKERVGILEKLRQTHDPAEKAELTHQLNMLNIQQQQQTARLAAAEKDRADQIAKQKKLHDDLTESQKWFGQRFLDMVGSWIGDQMSKLGTMVRGWTDNLGKLWPVILTKIQGFVNGAINWFEWWKTQAIQKAQDLINSIVTFFTNLPAQAVVWGSNLITGFINGINSMFSGLGTAMNGVVNYIGSFLPHSPAEQGELSHLDEYGPALVGGIADGMTKSADQVAKAAALIAQQAAPALTAIGYIHTANGVALPNYDQGTGQTIADVQPVAASSGGNSSLAGRDLHIHVHLPDSSGDAKKHAAAVAEEVKKQLAKMTRGQAVTPRYTSGGTR